MAKEDEEVTCRPLTRSEKVRNYLIGIGAASALILGLIAQFKGEPVANEVWDKLRKRVNRHESNIHKLHTRIVHLQGLEEGYHAGALTEKLSQLQRKYDALKASTITRGTSTKPSTPTAVVTVTKPPVKCTEGHIVVEGRCKRVTKAVAKAVKASAVAEDAAQKRFIEEKKRSMELERNKALLMKKLVEQKKQSQSIKQLAPLPAKVEDAK